MADSTIPNLDAVTTPAGTDEFSVRQSGDTRDKKQTRTQLHTFESGEKLLLDPGTLSLPGFAFNGDPDTGLRRTAVDQLSLIAGGVQVANLTETAGVVQFIVPLQNNAAAPSIAFGDGNSGFYEEEDNQIAVSLLGTARFRFFGDEFQAVIANGPELINEAASATNPTLVPRKGDFDTGIGSGGLDQLSLIAGALDCINISEVGSARQIGFYVTAPIALQTGVAVTAGGIHAALVNLGLITA